MAQRKQSLFLAGGVLLAALAAVGLSSFLRGLNRPRPVETLEGTREPERPAATTLTPLAGEGPDDSRMATIPDPALSVTPVNEEGLPLHLAQVVLDGPGGRLESTGISAWEDIEVGEWTVDVSCEGYLAASETVNVIDGGQPDLLVTLYRSVDVTGRVRDSLGAPVPLTAVRFLKKDSPPRMPRATRGEPQVLTQPDGSFSIQLEEAREYRLSVGAGTAPLLTMEGSILLDAGDHEVDIVVPGQGSVELALTQLPNAAKSKKGTLQARIFTRKAGGGGQGTAAKRNAPSEQGTLPVPVLPPGQGGQGGQDGGERANPKRRVLGGTRPEGSGASAPKATPKADEDPLAMDPLGPEWVHKESSVVGLDGSASFDGLRAGRDYRLVLEVRRVRFQSVDTFQVDPERRVVLRAAVPSLPTNEEGKVLKGTIRPLDVFVTYETVGPDVPPVGFHWAPREK